MVSPCDHDVYANVLGYYSKQTYKYYANSRTNEQVEHISYNARPFWIKYEKS